MTYLRITDDMRNAAREFLPGAMTTAIMRAIVAQSEVQQAERPAGEAKCCGDAGTYACKCNTYQPPVAVQPEVATEHDENCDTLQLGPDLGPSTKPCNCRREDGTFQQVPTVCNDGATEEFVSTPNTTAWMANDDDQRSMQHVVEQDIRQALKSQAEAHARELDKLRSDRDGALSYAADAEQAYQRAEREREADKGRIAQMLEDWKRGDAAHLQEIADLKRQLSAATKTKENT